MSLTKTVIFILFHFGAFGFSINNNEMNNHFSCVKECSGPFEISQDFLSKPSIKYRKYKARITTYPSTVTIAFASRRRWINICYDGSFIDPNTRCTSEFQQVAPSKTEVLEWSSRKQCKIGHLCYPDGDCWGSDHEKCKDMQAFNWVDNSKLEFVGSRYMFFSHHTCISTWECEYKDLTFPIHLCNMGSEETCIYRENGELLPISILSSGYMINNYTMLYSIKEIPRSKTFHSQLDCYQTNDAFYCLLDIGNEKIPVEITLKQKKGIFKENVIEIIDPMLSIDDPDREISYTTSSSPPGASASISDLELLFAGLKIDMLANEANDATVIDFTNQVVKVINRMIKSLAKIDDLLIGNLMDEDFTTIWQTSDIFKLCNCSQKIPGNTNCDAGRLYYRGRIIKNSKIENCKMMFDSPSKINFFNLTNMTFPELKITSFETSSNYLDGWSWIIKKELSDNRDSSSGNTRDEGSNSGRYFTNNIISFPIDTFVYYFNLITSISFWIYLLILRR